MTNRFLDWTRSLGSGRKGTRDRPSQRTRDLGNLKNSSNLLKEPPVWVRFCSCIQIRKIHPPIMFGLAVASLTSVVGYRFYNQPRLSVGTRSPVTVIAPKTVRLLDQKTTEERRKEARTGIIPVLKQDSDLTQKLALDLQQVLGRIDRWRFAAAPFPMLSTAQIDTNSQHFLRSCPEEQWKQILEAIAPVNSDLSERTGVIRSSIPAVARLQALKANLSSDDFRNILTPIKRARLRYNNVREELGDLENFPLTAPHIERFLALKDEDWQKHRNSIERAAESILAQGIPAGLPNNLLRSSIQHHLKWEMPPALEQVATDLLMEFFRDRPTLIVDREATKHQAEAVAQAIEPVFVSVKAGTRIVNQGEEITQTDFVLLDGLGLSRRSTNWQGLLLTSILVGGSVAILCTVSRRIHRPLRRRDQLLLCLMSLTVPVMGLVDPRYSNLPAVGLLSGSYYGPTIAVTQTILIGGLSTFSLEAIAWEYVLGSMAGSLVAAFLAGRLRSRDELAMLGVGVGLTQGSVYLVGHLILSASAGTIWYALLPGALFFGAIGMAWSVLALGISPYLERLFDVVTPIRLVELSNPNGPLLKRLAMETPGTFQHTLFVACLAEAAARELHCNVELVRTGTLYHDIGKMHDPLGFIENQMGCGNKHDEIGDPWQSVDIIKKHVSEGLVMARKYGLPRVVQDFIPEHQGQLLVSYFYYQARQKAEAQGLDPDSIDEADFRYPGPIPQSRETGIVMLADGCEAALRSLKDATPESALAMINKIFKARWRDGQLADCGLKYEELPVIADIFVRVWQQFHHQRLSYPKAALEPPCIKVDPQGCNS